MIEPSTKPISSAFAILLVLAASSCWAQPQTAPRIKLNDDPQPPTQTTTASNETKTNRHRSGKYAYKRHRSVTYAKYGDNQKLLCDVYVPEGKGPFPTILLIHGGSWQSGTKLYMKGHAQSAAEKGFVAVSINYRHAPRFKWPAQIDDCGKALKWMLDHADRYKIDPGRVALWGYSAGGHLATYLAARKEKVLPEASIKCVVCGGGPVDLTVFPKDFPILTFFIGATPREAPEKYIEASPITYLSANDPPIFFYHGENDVVAPLSGVKKMVAKAKQVGVPCELMMVPKKEHVLTFFDQASYDRALEFIEKQMEPAK